MIEVRILPHGEPFYKKDAFTGSKLGGLDLRVTEDVMLSPNEIKMVPSGLSVWLQDPFLLGLVYIRSSVGRMGVRLANGTGIIDPDYQGELIQCLHNYGGKPINFNTGDRVAQLIVMPQISINKHLQLVQEFTSETERGTGGFGSTGTS